MIAITGSSGFISKNLRSFCSKQKIPTLCLSRKSLKPKHNEICKTTINYSEERLVRYLKNCSAIIHLVGIGKQTNDDSFIHANTQITKNVISLCKKAHIPKMIYLSGLGVSSNNVTDYYISKYVAEQHIVKSGLDYTIFRPSYIIGKDDEFTKFLNKQIKKNLIRIPGTGTYRLQPIHINNVVKLLIDSTVSSKFSNIILDLVGPQIITYTKFVSLFCKFRNKSTPTLKISLQQAYYTAIRGNGEFRLDDLHILVGDFIGNHNRLASCSDVKFMTINDILKSSVTL